LLLLGDECQTESLHILQKALPTRRSSIVSSSSTCWLLWLLLLDPVVTHVYNNRWWLLHVSLRSCTQPLLLPVTLASEQLSSSCISLLLLLLLLWQCVCSSSCCRCYKWQCLSTCLVLCSVCGCAGCAPSHHGSQMLRYVLLAVLQHIEHFVKLLSVVYCLLLLVLKCLQEQSILPLRLLLVGCLLLLLVCQLLLVVGQGLGQQPILALYHSEQLNYELCWR
jgi:hypothetical protein